MSKPLVYLAGAIAGRNYFTALDWRNATQKWLLSRGIETLSPLRAKDALANVKRPIISTDFHDYETDGVFFTSWGIMARDYNDVRRCDALLVNLLGLTKPSLGTVMELAWAHALRKPAVVAIEASGNPHDNHPMIFEAMASYRVETLDEAIDAVAVILNR